MQTKIVSKSDIKEGYEFNLKSKNYKNRRTAVLRIWKNREKIDLYYHQRGNYYPKKSNSPIHIRPRQLINPKSSWLSKEELEKSLKEEELDQLNKFYKEYKREFWQDVDWKKKIKKSEVLNPALKDSLAKIKFNFQEVKND